MKNKWIFLLILIAVMMGAGCKKEDNETGPVPLKGEVRFSNGKVMAPGAVIISGGRTFTGEAGLSGDRLVAVKYNDTVYFYFTGIRDSTCRLDKNLSKRSIATYILSRAATQVKSGEMDIQSWNIPTGLKITEVVPLQKYDFTNFKVRWAAVDNGTQKYFFCPKTFISVSFMNWLRGKNLIGVDVQDTKTVPYTNHQVKTYGSVVRAWALPASLFGLLVDTENLKEGFAQDPETVARINAADFIQILFEGIEEIIGVVPFGECLDTVINPILEAMRGLGTTLLVGNENAMDIFGGIAQSFCQDLSLCIAGLSSIGAVEAAKEFINAFLAMSWVGEAIIVGSWDAATTKYYATWIPPGANPFIQGACQEVPVMFPPGTTAFGNQAHGYEGDFDCWSDVYLQNGVRISPGGGNGRAYYDYGPVSGGSVSVTFQWVDNAWWSDTKAVEVYNWTAKAWDRIATWTGNDGQEHYSTYGIPVTPDRIGPAGQVRVAVWGGSSSVIHLNTITVN